MSWGCPLKPYRISGPLPKTARSSARPIWIAGSGANHCVTNSVILSNHSQTQALALAVSMRLSSCSLTQEHSLEVLWPDLWKNCSLHLSLTLPNKPAFLKATTCTCHKRFLLAIACQMGGTKMVVMYNYIPSCML